MFFRVNFVRAEKRASSLIREIRVIRDNPRFRQLTPFCQHQPNFPAEFLIFYTIHFQKCVIILTNPQDTNPKFRAHIGEITMTKVIFVLSLCALLIIPSLSIANVAEDGLVAYWPFDEGDGKKAEDITGNGHDGEFNGNPKWIDGKFGTGLEFDGEEDHVVVADDPAFSNSRKILPSWRGSVQTMYSPDAA